MDKIFRIKFHTLKNTQPWVITIGLSFLILLILICRLKIKDRNLLSSETSVEPSKKNVETFRANTRGYPIHVFSSNWPFPPKALQKYRFCGNDGYCNPGHSCTDKLYGAMFPPVCTCYEHTPQMFHAKKPPVEQY